MTELVTLFKPDYVMRNLEGDTWITMNQYQASNSVGSRLTDKYLSQALVHLFKISTLEVKKFNSKDGCQRMHLKKESCLLEIGCTKG